MLTPDPPCSMSSAEKKRLRDRRAQQNLRDKKLRHTAQLEEKVAHCEQHHSNQSAQRLLQVIEGLRTQNEDLLARQKQLAGLVAHCEQHHNNQSAQRLLQVIEGLRKQNEDLLARQRQLAGLVQSWDIDSVAATTPSEPQLPPPPPIPAPYALGELNHHRKLLEAEQQDLKPRVAGSPTTADDPHAMRLGSSAVSTPPLPPTSPVESVLCLTDSCPPWKLTPLNNDDFSLPTTAQTAAVWFAYPERIASSPDSPASPLDILYGTKTNPLAHMIHEKIRSRPLRDPECLAFGWTLYHMTKWIFAPSPDSYARIPEYFKPVLGQVQTPHPVLLDFMIWPQIRLNLMQRWEVYKNYRDDLFGLFTCCVKVRWPWGEGILERDEQNELRIRPDFYNTFMRETGWGLTPEFIRRYPDVVEGVDVRSIIYEVV